MGHIFRLKRAGAVATKTTIVGWSNSTATTYNLGMLMESLMQQLRKTK